MPPSSFSELLEQNESVRRYFHSLPPMVQESIRLSGVTIENEEQLRNLAEQMMRSGQ